MSAEPAVPEITDISLDGARALDEADPLAPMRARFAIPPAPKGSGEPSIYLVGNSLGCMPRRAREILTGELDAWERLGVEAHFHAERPWFSYHEQVTGGLARLVGAKPVEVVAMNGLTPNLHLMMVSFYRPSARRYRIAIEDTAFPSDSYAVQSQARYHAERAGFDPDDAILRLKPRPGEHALRTEDILQTLRREGEQIELVLLGGVNYLSGQWFDMAAITEVAHEIGAAVGWDCAHAAGNVPLQLHEWGPDFACWCSYKYLNSGPGAIAGCFVHERHADDPSIPRFAGWWGHDARTRFRMGPDFDASRGAEGWQLANPPVLATAPLIASLELFDEAGMPALRAKSQGLTGFMERCIDELCAGKVEIRTPRDPASRGCQLSLGLAGSAAKTIQQALLEEGVIADFREPDVVRVAPVPLYNTYEDVRRFVEILARVTG